MSLSTQLTRGTLALPLLALLGLLALVAGEPVDSHRHESRALPPAATATATAAASSERRQMIAAGRRLVVEARAADIACGLHGRPQLLLAQAPGDLGPMAQRHGGGCRA